MTGTDDRLNRKLLLEYDQKKKLYDDFLVMILRFLGEFIKENSLGVHSFEGVVSSRETMQERLENGLEVSCIEDINDFVTVQILTYFEDDVQAVAHVLDTEFKIIKGANKDLKAKTPKHFGYQFQSYLVRMMDSRLEWIEYRCFKECRVKVEVSSLLQNTWRLIQNRMAINAESVPHHQLRPTERIVGLFELADRELNKLKNTLPISQLEQVSQLTGSTPAVLPQEDLQSDDPLAAIKDAAKQDFSAISVKKEPILKKTSAQPQEQEQSESVWTQKIFSRLILDDANVRRIDRLISDSFFTRLKFDTDFVDRLCGIANNFYIPSQDILLKFMQQNEKNILWHSETLIKKPGGDSLFIIPRGISILLLFHYIASEAGDKEAIDKIVTIVHHSFSSQ
jgi:ppGpp synthetase/RelA/SpoT-type nucleotidyltranferase